MSLTLALNTALSGLSVNQKALEVLSQNIANANNPDYSRKTVTQQAVYLQGTGAGVTITDIGRNVDATLQKSVMTQGGDYARTSVMSDYSDRLQVLLGKPGADDSIYSDITSYFNSMQQLSQTPENAALRVSTINTAQTVTQSLNSLTSGINDMQYSIDQDISQSVSAVNSDLKQIYQLNATVASDKLLGRSVSELEDKRDSLLKDISQYMDIQTYEQPSGVMSVFAAGGYSLVDDNMYALSYNPANSSDFFANGTPTSPINIYRLDANGKPTGTPSTLVSAGVGSAVQSQISNGKLKGLLDMRDKQLPDVVAKIDMLAANVRDQVNAVHNAGIAFPGANSYTGTRAVEADSYSQWSGQVRIALLDQNGKPVQSNYSDEDSGMRPLLLDLSTLDTGNSAGYPSVQGIVDQINRYYGVPQDKTELGNLNNVQLVLNNDTIPGATPQLNFDFQLDNISGQNTDFYVTNVQVLDDTNTDITNVAQDVPQVALASTNTYVTTAGSSTVTVNTAGTHNFKNGDRIYLSPPASSIDGISPGQMSGFYTISNVTPTSFTVSLGTPATAGGSYNASNVNARPVYYTSQTGTDARTTSAGTITANISAHPLSSYFTVNASVASIGPDGQPHISTVTYRIDNQGNNVKNYPYAARSATGDGDIVHPNTTPALVAKLVDANGVELPKINGRYVTNQQGYLQISAGNSNSYVAIDSMDSSENGKPNSIPALAGSGRGFSYFFELNNFFDENRTSGGLLDDVAGSARNLSVQKRLVNNVNLISMGGLTQSIAPADTSKPPLYTYETNIGDNSAILKLSNLSTQLMSFGAAGDLGANQQTLVSYAGQILSTTSSKADTNKSDMDNSKLLLDGFNDRSQSARGVNLDEELANTIIYQNAYSASARIITVANQFFDALMEAVK